ncbi:hypothetical protein SAMN03159371_07413 [Variovorax sp. NFACC28]|nr:hypothetical protein SAMN03159371_07413 [Variovorax sp. NFACC28]SFH18517.1 hypothetical protein SAMN03159447_07110 [Variovorax sp. NFACC27]
MAHPIPPFVNGRALGAAKAPRPVFHGCSVSAHPGLVPVARVCPIFT